MKQFRFFVIAMAFMPFAAVAQSVDNSALQQNTISLSELQTSQLTEEEKAYLEDFKADLQNTAAKINENADQWAQETAKRGYPKKKTVKEKAELVDHYIFLLSTQLSDSLLNHFLDKEKAEQKLIFWQNYRQSLERLL